MTADRYRRRPGLVLYWSGPQALAFAWQSAGRVPLSPDAISILHSLSDWASVDEIHDRVASGSDRDAIEGLLGLFHSLGLVEREHHDVSNAEWSKWSPEAAFFHFATKNGAFPEDLGTRNRELVEKAKLEPPPAPVKNIDGRRMRLPSAALPEDLRDAFSRRRTWRNFSDHAVPASALGAVLDHTFGVQRRGHVPGQGPIIVRTSPSGGSRHPIEPYVLAWNVDGLKAGAYHYESDTRELIDLDRPIASRDIAPLLAHQTYFAAAGAIVVMCPVFARTMWRYEHSRAYRTVLIDAGHLGQTFCLAATALGLAPFTTMAFSEEALEKLLGLDGISECPIYVAGVGMPDPAAARAPGRIAPLGDTTT